MQKELVDQIEQADYSSLLKTTNITNVIDQEDHANVYISKYGVLIIYLQLFLKYSFILLIFFHIMLLHH